MPLEVDLYRVHYLKALSSFETFSNHWHGRTFPVTRPINNVSVLLPTEPSDGFVLLLFSFSNLKVVYVQLRLMVSCHDFQNTSISNLHS